MFCRSYVVGGCYIEHPFFKMKSKYGLVLTPGHVFFFFNTKSPYIVIFPTTFDYNISIKK